MFTRSFSVLVMLVVAGTLSVTSAMATDEPAPGTPGSPQAACVDNMRPLSHLRVGWRSSFRNGVIRGIAIDQGCGAAGAGKVTRVSISINRKVGKRCQHLMANGRLSHTTACGRVWLPAKGTNAWSFRLQHKLPKGKYIVSSRALDSAGNLEARAKS